MVEIQTGFIYKLCCRDVTVKEVYVGSTKNLRVRKNKHKSNCNNQNSKKYNFNVYQFIRANGGFGNWNLIQVEEVEYTTKHQLRARERFFFELLNATLNKQVPNRTHLEYGAKYREENRDEINAKQNTKHNCVCGGVYSQCGKSRHFATNKHLLYLSNLEKLKLLSAQPIGDNATQQATV
jgi:hypothetical protein